MRQVKTKLYGIVLIFTGLLYGSIFYPLDTNATILSGIDEPTGNAYEDAYIAEEEKATITSGSNQTTNTNTTQVP
jgi:hypothetical protein